MLKEKTSCRCRNFLLYVARLACALLVDVREKGVDQRMTMSHVAARQEVRALLEGLGLPEDSDNSDDKFGPKAHDEAGSAAISALPL